MSPRGQKPTSLNFVSIQALRDVTRWTHQPRSERDSRWSHWNRKRRREVENIAWLASAARRAARTTVTLKVFRCISSKRTKNTAPELLPTPPPPPPRGDPRHEKLNKLPAAYHRVTKVTEGEHNLERQRGKCNISVYILYLVAGYSYRLLSAIQNLLNAIPKGCCCGIQMYKWPCTIVPTK